jgi:putative transposase
VPGWILASWCSPRSGVLQCAGLGRWKARPRRSRSRTRPTAATSAISCAEVPVKPLPLTDEATGIDLGLESFASLADGRQIANPRILRVAELNLKRAQRRVSRRTRGSHRRRQAVALLAKAHQQVRRARADCHHKTALALIRQYDTISHEDVQTANMDKNHHLAKSISDAGWSAFLSILSFKAVEAGKTVVAVPPASTSQACSGCGVLVHKGVSVRWHSCPDCGTSLHRDHNAALNIVRLGTERSGAGQAPQASTWSVGASVA